MVKEILGVSCLATWLPMTKQVFSLNRRKINGKVFSLLPFYANTHKPIIILNCLQFLQPFR